MVIWAAAWGAVLGVLWADRLPLVGLLLGLALGALAGHTLRRALRREIAAILAAAPAAGPSVAAEAPSPGPAAATAPPAQAPVRQPFKPPAILTELARQARDRLLGGNTIVRAGVLVLFVGLAFLARYAIDHALLPPALRLALVALAGVVLFGVGWRLRDRPGRTGAARTLQGGGVAALYLTVFAALRLYGLLSPGLAFAVLALVCAFAAVAALAQQAQSLAFIGFAGGFAAPLLVSTGQGQHVGLFGYYLVLGLAIAAIAWHRPWRALNLLGFLATFAVATVWGVLQYHPGQFATVQPFLAAFFAVYLAVTLMHALRHGLAARRAVDATLVFGLPLVGFGLQAALVRGMPFGAAFSALLLGALYLGLGQRLARRHPGAAEPGRWLAECFAALGLGFATLAVPLALDGRWTSAVWAVEGAGIYWLGQRQARWRARATGLGLQLLAAVAYLGATAGPSRGLLPLAHPDFIGAAMLAGSALAIAWWSREPAAVPPGRLAAGFHRLESVLSPGLFWIGFLWLQFAWHTELTRAPLDRDGRPEAVFGTALQLHLKLLAWVAAAFAFERLARPERARPWPVAATPGWTVLPVLLLGAVAATDFRHALVQGGWIVWPLLLTLHLRLLHRLDSGEPAGWWHVVHAGGVWLLVLLAGDLLLFAVERAALWRTAWAAAVLLVAGTAVLLLLCRQAPYRGASRHWPLDRFAPAYLWTAAAPLAAALTLAALGVALLSNGDARPLPYLPLLNPTDLTVALALATVALWLLRVRRSTLPLPPLARDPRWLLVPAVAGFVAVNTAWLRVAHHHGGVAWDAGALWSSFLVQAGYSILWTVLALALMVASFRRGWRRPWMAGGALLALTVLKLFLVDLANRGGGERIVVFIAVGALMLVVGWFAPLPPAPRKLAPATTGPAAP